MRFDRRACRSLCVRLRDSWHAKAVPTVECGRPAIRRWAMAKFTIQPHGRLQEWIAHENGYYRGAGLDYEFRGGLSAQRKKEVDAGGRITDVFSGAFESYRQGKGNKGVKSDISCACHWAVNQASSQQIGTMWGKSYVVTPGGVMVPPDSGLRRPEDLAGQELAVGYHSGSHFTTLPALQPFVAPPPAQF